MSERAGERSLPPRPVIPLALPALVAILLAEHAVMGGACGARTAVFVGLAVAMVGVLTCRLGGERVGKPGRVLLAMGVACVLAAGVAGLRARAVVGAADALGQSPVSAWEFELLGDMSPTSTGWRGRARAVREGESALVWLSTSEEHPLGERISCVGRFSPNGDDDWGASSRSQGISGTVRAVVVTRSSEPEGLGALVRSVRTWALGSLRPRDSRVGAVLAACVCGYSAPLRECGLADEFSEAGISHMTAVSGAHLALVASLVSRLLEALGARPAARGVTVALTCGAFVILCGMPVSALRAWAMSCAGELVGASGRRGHQLSTVGVVGIAMALADPTLSGQLGFLLSVASVVGIGLFSAWGRFALEPLAFRIPWWAPVPGPLRRTVGGLGRGASEVLAVSLVCQASTVAMSAATFGSVSLVAPLANLVASPAFSLLLPLGLGRAVLGRLPVAGDALRLACEAVGTPLFLAVDWLSALPLSTVPVEVELGPALALTAAGAMALLAWWPRPDGRLLGRAVAAAALVLALAFVRLRWLAPPRVCVLDVGQGDAILVQDGAHALLVDAGPGDAVASALARSGVLHLDAVLVTHLHDDHYGGLSSLRGLGVGGVLFGEGVADGLPAEVSSALGELGTPVVGEVYHGDVLRVGGFSLTVVSPVGETAGDRNADSVELLLSYDGGEASLTGLLTGDAERDETGAAVARGEVGDVDFLKVGHHGSAVSVDAELARALAPEVSVASAGRNNRYGHPKAECASALREAGSLFLCTMDAGDVTLMPGEGGVRVRTQRDALPPAS